MSVIRFKHLYPECKIIVFEADAYTCGILEQNVRSIGLDNIEIICAAAWKANGTIGFESDGADGGMVTECGRGVRVPAVRLADRISGKVDLLKLDVEGSEYEIIDDLIRTGKIQLVERIVCEIHGDSHAPDRYTYMLAGLVESGFYISFNQARSAPDLPGKARGAPFPSITDGKFLLNAYAWKGTFPG